VDVLRIFLASDIHDRPQLLLDALRRETYDVLVVAGDFTYLGGLDYVLGMLRELRKYSRGPILFVPGNCDPEGLLEVDLPDQQIYNLHARSFRLESTIFVGIGGSNITPFSTRIEFAEDDIEGMLMGIAESIRAAKDPIILVTHAPPYGTLDMVRSGRHVGSLALRKALELLNPAAVLCGHIHESRGVLEAGGTLIVNPGPAAYGYYAMLEVAGSKVSARLRIA